MSKRITFMIDDDNSEKVLAQQIKMMKETNNTYSFSKAVNDLLRGDDE